MKTHGTAVLQGGIKDGKGAISTKSGALKDYPYGFSSRFEGKPGTNPEELIGAETGDERRENLRRSVQRQAPKGSNYCAAEFPAGLGPEWGPKAERLAASIFRPDYPPRADIVDALWHFRFVARSWRAAGIDVAIKFT